MNFKGIGSLVTAIILSTGLTSSVSANEKSICGVDDRVPSTIKGIGRALGSITEPGGCTVTMISKTCAVSAGHCASTFGIIEFNTPPSINGQIQHPSEENIYPVNKATTVSNYRGIGDDWAVVRVEANPVTGLYAGDAEGTYEVDFVGPENGDIIRITGYGLDRSDPERNLAQQTHTGEVVSMRGSAIYHIADTMGGNSGSSIIRESDSKIIGIHTNGGCSTRGGSNSGTIISQNQQLADAIRTCLSEEALSSL